MMLHKECIRCLAGIRPLRIRIRTSETASRPGVPHTVDLPVLLNLVSSTIIPGKHGICVTACYLSRRGAGRMCEVSSVGTTRGKMVCLHPLLYHLVTVDDVDDGIIGAVKYDRRDDARKVAHSSVGQLSLPNRCRSTLT